MVCNFATSIMSLLCYQAVKMLPLGDYIVFCFTAPLFTLIISVILRRYTATFVDIVFCLILTAGACLVAQPTFLFGQPTTPLNPGFREEAAAAQGTYAEGALMSISVAVIAGFVVIGQERCRVIPTTYYMFFGSAATLIVGLFYGLVFSSTFSLTGLVDNMGYLAMIGSSSMFGLMFIQIGVNVSNPVLVSSTRSVEIVMALILTICLPPSGDKPIDFSDIRFHFKVAGSFLVMISVVGIALSRHIYDQIIISWGCVVSGRNRKDYDVIVEEGSNNDDK